MRAGLSTIQQTLTPEAASILNQSIAEAGRRNHGQTTPLHVAATLLASSSGYLRQACIRSHPNSSHPLQCRALELCFSVALDRLPSAQNISPPLLEPPISNALMAALKRAQAHQRRGCPEQQQQPLLAVKVELEQLVISILDDPSVSRVMREASFSSPAVKATIEQTLNSTTSGANSSGNNIASCGVGLGGFRPAQSANRNLYLNPRLQQQQGNNCDQSNGGQRKEEVKKVVDILMRSKKRNPVLVGENEPELVVRELLQRIERKQVGECLLRNVQVVSLEKEFGSDRSQIPMKVKELEGLVESRISNGNGSGGVILNLGDLKWLVEQPAGLGGLGSGQGQQQIVSETGRVAVAEMGKLLARFGEGSNHLWLIGTATCETYLRCQVYHPSMENDWDLQAVPIAARAPLPGLFPRMGGNGILSSSVESLTPMKNFPMMTTPLSRRLSENMDPSRKTKCCPLCMQSYEQELVKLRAKEFEKPSPEAKAEATRPPLPQWLQLAKPDSGNTKSSDQSQSKDQDMAWKQKSEELQKKWNDTCLRLHPSFHHSVASERNAPTTFSMSSLYNLTPLGSQPFQPKLQLNRNLGGSLRLNQNPVQEPPAEQVVNPPGSPVRTDLALGHPKVSECITERIQTERRVRDFIGCIPSEPEKTLFESKKDKLAGILDPDSFKALFKGLAEKVCWQNEAASAVASTVIQCRSGSTKREGFGCKSDAWLLFAGPDRVGKKKMAMALSELVCRSSPVTIRLGFRSNDDEELGVNVRGKTIVDQIAEAVQRNPSSVVVLEDIDQADMLVRGSIKRAIERGRLPDSRGREVSLKNVIFILTANGLPENLEDVSNEVSLREDKLAKLARRGWQLHLSVGEKTRKRCADWLQENNKTAKPRTGAGSTLSFDLNEAALGEDDRAGGSLNSSDLTVEHDHENNLINNQFPVTPIPRELLCSVDETIVFRPVDFGPLQKKVASTISAKFSRIVDGRRTVEVDREALDQIVGGIWFGRTELEEWVEKVLVPSFHKLKGTLSSSTINDDNTTIKLVSVSDSMKPGNGDLLPSNITVVTVGF
ncbi:hypothetical protein IFM89_023546 [Coptis chinensis]|uniref:Clp R domain-containing protein n=1 Tax=Coptis chinensis TaxID=261450 RepID=A0A835IAR1_9MAGN|nr:hypothetical protein IFM89_023546 [Coptis chinensis]